MPFFKFTVLEKSIDKNKRKLETIAHYENWTLRQ